MTEEEKRLRRCCFTGHRASKLDESEAQVRKWLEDRIDEAVAEGKTTFLTGMGMGVDLWQRRLSLPGKRPMMPSGSLLSHRIFLLMLDGKRSGRSGIQRYGRRLTIG